jgi:hypothetical protein
MLLIVLGRKVKKITHPGSGKNSSRIRIKNTGSKIATTKWFYGNPGNAFLH